MENQRLPGDTSYSDSQAAHSEPQTTFPGTEEVYSDSQTAYSKPQAAYPDTQLAYSKTEDAYLESQGSFSDTEDAYEEPQLGYADLYPDSAGYAGTGFASFPIQNQPGCSLSDETGEALGMPEPTRPLDCPPGLECLSRMDEMLILQDIRLLDVFANFLTNNKYQMRNSLGQTVLFAVEDSEWYSRITCGTYRPFTLRIFNNMDQEVITLERPLRCSKCCFPWFLQEIKSVDEDSVVGKISKQSSGFVKEIFINAGNIEIQFPKDLSGTMKAVVLGACFLIDFMFFEGRGYVQQIVFM
ncbi:phospholipid scramblase 1 isoform X5 [Oryctolagus cuniculus]|uniref:phospholipid scramblase 1 isoform X5 n=1 Tax=Oryctolagus cuniculus TaxID=9986 RepID=UPI002230958B|nr:phospholipid scramblase 1 isoform X6 [Oryctolagus cuniculus]